jgi:hypothetical protein
LLKNKSYFLYFKEREVQIQTCFDLSTEQTTTGRGAGISAPGGLSILKLLDCCARILGSACSHKNLISLSFIQIIATIHWHLDVFPDGLSLNELQEVMHQMAWQ